MEAPGRQKDPEGHAKGAALEEPGGQKVPSAQLPLGAPLEQSMPGGQGAQVRARIRWLRLSAAYSAPDGEAASMTGL